MPQVRIAEELAERVLAAELDAPSLAKAVEAVLERGLAIDFAPSDEVEKPEQPQVARLAAGPASVRGPKRGSLWQ